MGSLDESQQARQLLDELAVADAWGARRAAEVSEIPSPLALVICTSSCSSNGGGVGSDGVLAVVAAGFLLPLRIEAACGSE